MESTLSLKKTDLEGEVGFFLGFGRGTDNGDTAWSTKANLAIQSCVKSGLRQFYFPPPLPGEKTAHTWSFLKPVATLTLADGEQELRMPDDYGGMIPPITINSDNQVTPWVIPITGEGRIRQMYSTNPTATGRPQMVGISAEKGTEKKRSQRTTLTVYPIADQDYDFQIPYFILPDCLTGDYPYCYGGAMHHETLLESCLSIAEKRLDDMMTVHHSEFMLRLAASVSLDRMNQPRNYGYNGDRSDGMKDRYDRWRYDTSYVTYNGVRY